MLKVSQLRTSMYGAKSVTYKDGVVVLQELLSENEVQA